MNKAEFDDRLVQCTEAKDITVLADEVFEEINDGIVISIMRHLQRPLQKNLLPLGIASL